MHHLCTKIEKNWPASGGLGKMGCLTGAVGNGRLTGGQVKMGALPAGKNKRRNTNEKNTRMRR